MADCIIDLSEESPVTSLGALTPLVEVSPPLPTARLPSPSTLAISQTTPSHKPPKAHRWYLRESEEGSSSTELSLTLDRKHLPPVKINASKKSTKWEIVLPSDREKGEFYDITLGVSTRSLDMDAIESILMRFEQNRATIERFECEVFKRRELERMSMTDVLYKDTNKNTGVDMDKGKDGVKEMHGQEIEESVTEFKWKLFTRCYGFGDGVSITMEINTWLELPSEFGSLDLHFVELCTDSTALYKADPLFREHCPYSNWLIDINRSECPEYDSLTRTFKQATHFSNSGDGRFVAIRTLADEDAFLEVWDLLDYEIAAVLGGDGSENTEKITVKPHRATPVAWMPLIRGREVDVSISWDGSLVAVLETEEPEPTEDDKEDSPQNYRGCFAIYKFSRNDNGASEKPSSRMSLVRHDVQHTCPGLKDYIGSGVFHMVDKSNPDPKDELFVVCNGIIIEIYSTFEDWIHLRSIVMDSAFASQSLRFDMACTMFNQCQGRYLVTTNDTVAFTFDIMLKTLVSFSTNPSKSQLYWMNYLSYVSVDGDWVAIPGYRHVYVYRTQTWTLQGSYVFDEVESDERVAQSVFIDSGRLLYVMIGLIEDISWQRRPGYILDVATMSVVGRIAANGFDYVRPARLDGLGQGMIYFGYTKLWDTCLEDRRTYRSPTGDVSRCTSRCNHLDSIHFGVKEGTSPSGLRLTVQRTDTSIGSQLKRDKRSSVTVTMTDPTGTQVKKMVIPLPRSFTLEKAALFADCRYLLVVAHGTFMAWSVPTTVEGDFRLQMILKDEPDKEWTICTHGIVGRSSDEGEEGRHHVGHIKQPFTEPLVAEFLDGLGTMVEFYELADVDLRQDILRYYGRHINSYPDKDKQFWNVMNQCVSTWDSDNHHTMCSFVKGLLSFPGVHWVPHYNKSIELNPLAGLLDKAKTEPFANAGVQIIVDYCLRQAKATQDPHFLWPILQCLPSLVDPKQQYSEMAQTIYREVAFLPAQAPKFVIRHHALANPVNFRWAFWKPSPWGLHQYKDQVMRLDLVGTPNPPKDNFTRNIYQASFDLLWRKTEVEESQADPSQQEEKIPVQTLFSWPLAIWTMIRRKFRLRTKVTVECYPFELEVLDNPALKALVEYKWNTIGFNYWLVRFLGQVSYYIMVLTAIFLQIYGNQNVSEAKNGRIDLGLEGLFVAIIVVASVFLWLEFVQLLKDKRSYIRTIYNWVDLFVFLLPLAGSINQILIIQGVAQSGLNPGLLSFSVLFIFLHLLFELRVIRVVCHFVSIIIRAIYSIRVFFFVFAGGLLAFSIAIIHLIYACTTNCDYFTEGFSRNLLRALSVTYFMMGGNYDQVEAGFTSDSVAFHGMMMVFFFFTVIIMLNVLIALINNAINDGDQTWQLDWLEYRMRYVECAENMTYDIPGFRENHKYFPDMIYYTGTPLRVKEYQKKTRQLLEESAPGAPEGETKQVSESSSGTAGLEALDLAEREPKGQESKRAKATGLTATELEEQLDVERVNSENQIGELRQQLRSQQETLREQQQMLARILDKLDR